MLQIALQRTNTPRRRLLDPNPLRRDRAEEHTETSSARDQHVETLPAPVPIQRSEILGEVSSGIGPIPDAQENHLPFVPLDGLEVLDEEGFVVTGIEERRHRIIALVTTKELDLILDGSLLCDTERGDAERQSRRLVSMPDHFPGNRTGLLPVVAAASPKIDTVGNVAKLDPETVVAASGAREYAQIATVELPVGELDEQIWRLR